MVDRHKYKETKIWKGSRPKDKMVKVNGLMSSLVSDIFKMRVKLCGWYEVTTRDKVSKMTLPIDMWRQRKRLELPCCTSCVVQAPDVWLLLVCAIVFFTSWSTPHRHSWMSGPIARKLQITSKSQTRDMLCKNYFLKKWFQCFTDY